MQRNAYHESSALYAGPRNHNYETGSHQGNPTYNGNQHQHKQRGHGSNEDKKYLICTHFQMKGHTKETCYRLNGFLLGIETTKGTQTKNRNGYNNNRTSANNVVVENVSTGNNDGT